MPNSEEVDRTKPAGVTRVHETAVIKALANPARARMIDLLGTYGPSTVGWLAERTGLAAGSVSHHLAVLADAALVEEAEPEGADRRQRWWRRATAAIAWNAEDMDEPSGRLLAEAAEVQALERQHDMALQWITERDERPDWRSAAFATQTRMWLNPTEMEALMRDLNAVADRYKAIADQEGRAGREPVVVWMRALPNEP